MRRPVLIICTLAVLAAIASPPAGARVVDRERYADSESFTDEPCGYPLDVVFSYSGQLVVRDTKGGQAFRLRDTYAFRSVFTNPENGEWFVVHGHGTVNEVKATHVDGNIYEFVVNESGQPFILEDSDGNVIARDRGLIRETFLFDTLGDGQPGGEIVGESEVDLHGPHPAFGEELPFCDIVDELVGA
jgi:hypothetical protein